MMTLENFCEVYELNDSHIYANISSGMYPRSILSKVDGIVHVDEKYFIKRYEFARRIQNMAHEYYFALMQLFKNQYMIAGHLQRIYGSTIESWNSFLQYGLFYNSKTITNFKLSDRQWQFFRYSRAMLRVLFSMVGLNALKVDLGRLHYENDK
jgi:hypothetical protein